MTLGAVHTISTKYAKSKAKVFFYKNIINTCIHKYSIHHTIWYTLHWKYYIVLHLRYITNTLQLKVALEPWAWQADFPRLRNDYQREKAGLSCALLPPYKLIISPSICFFSLHSHNGVTFSIFSRALLVRAALASRPLQIGMASISNQTNTKTSRKYKYKHASFAPTLVHCAGLYFWSDNN